MSQGIRFSTSCPRVVDNLEVEIEEVFSILGLLIVKEFY
jgi:hypothetical protein